MLRLVTANGSRIELDHNRSYVLGRAPDCDVVVGDMACSRRHSRLTVGGERSRGLFIEDLGSRNGTYVNDERIWGRTSIRAGCTIRIGATVYLLVTGDEEALLDTGTVGVEKLSMGMDIDEEMLRVLQRHGPVNTNFAGKLETFGLIDVLQLLLHNHSSGTLHLVLDAGEGRIEIRQGEVYQANFAELDGFHALVMLARQKRGKFWLVENQKLCRKIFEETAARLLVEVCCAIDEKKALS
ncbi:MAG: FHA domain-containing protein [Planctomycetota bacterium]|jgi:hypothetical protein